MVYQKQIYLIVLIELVSELQAQGVVAAHHIEMKWWFTHVQAFGPSKHLHSLLPIHAGYLRCSVHPYIPNPLDCF